MSNTKSDELVSVDDDNVYISLRDELTKRIDIRYQLVNYTLAAFATLMTFGTSQEDSALVFLIYPPVATGLALAWVDNHYRLKLIASYLRQRGSHWENTLENYRKNHSSLLSREWLGSLSIGVIFLGTQFIAWASGLYVLITKDSSDSNLAGALMIVSFLTFLYTAYMLVVNHKEIEIDISNDEGYRNKTSSKPYPSK